MTMTTYPRDLIGYAKTPSKVQWPKLARIAVQFVINYEEGGESCVLHGDPASEAFLSELVGAQPWPGQRHMNMESIYEYGSRAGYWRLWRLFNERELPVTVFAVAMAMQRNPNVVASMNESGWEIATHGLKWIDYKDFDRDKEAQHIREAIRIHTAVAGEPPLGFYQGRCSANTLDIIMEEQGFLYSSDSYADDLPYWIEGKNGPQLIVPYTLDANDMRFATAQGFNAGDQFYNYLKDSFDVLYQEGSNTPKMLSIGLHCRLAGRPGRSAALARFLDYVQRHDQVWVARRIDIARHWVRHHPPKGGYVPSRMPRALFLEKFADVFEGMPMIAATAHRKGLTRANDSATGLHRALVETMWAMNKEDKLSLVRAHPDLGGHPKSPRQLSEALTREQSEAGLEQLTPNEIATLTSLNAAYRQQFGFPFILAVEDRTKSEIMVALRTRLKNDADTEFNTALEQIERNALMRLKNRLPE
jgi:OHCU decarboxylase